jgi:hypothetical protein
MKVVYWLRVQWKLWLRKHRLVESFCKNCGRDVHDFHAPLSVWEKIHYIRHGNVLCFDCFCDACQQVGIPYGGAWRLSPIDCGHNECGIEELHCQRCHTDYEVWFTSGKLWNKVALEGERVIWHFLCPTCFVVLAAEAGIKERWLLTNDTANADMLSELRHLVQNLLSEPHTAPFVLSWIPRTKPAAVVCGNADCKFPTCGCQPIP